MYFFFRRRALGRGEKYRREVDGGDGGMHANTEGGSLGWGVSLVTYYVCMHVKYLCY